MQLRPAVSKKTAWKTRVALSSKSIDSVWLICAHVSVSEKASFCVPAWSGP